MHKPGFRWAPRTYINQHHASRIEIVQDEKSALVHSEGSNSWLVLHCPAVELLPPAGFQWPESNVLYITMHGRVYAATTLMGNTWYDVTSKSKASQLCIILRKKFVDSTTTTNFRSAGLLVNMTRDELESTRVVFNTAIRLEVRDSGTLVPDTYTSMVKGKSSISGHSYQFFVT
ncbi:hypothetical protein AB5N19_03991 [Seiridium cardinale]